jgi:hypothetical protein
MQSQCLGFGGLDTVPQEVAIMVDDVYPPRRAVRRACLNWCAVSTIVIFIFKNSLFDSVDILKPGTIF